MFKSICVLCTVIVVVILAISGHTESLATRDSSRFFVLDSKGHLHSHSLSTLGALEKIDLHDLDDSIPDYRNLSIVDSRTAFVEHTALGILLVDLENGKLKPTELRGRCPTYLPSTGEVITLVSALGSDGFESSVYVWDFANEAAQPPTKLDNLGLYAVCPTELESGKLLFEKKHGQREGYVIFDPSNRTIIPTPIPADFRVLTQLDEGTLLCARKSQVFQVDLVSGVAEKVDLALSRGQSPRYFLDSHNMLVVQEVIERQNVPRKVNVKLVDIGTGEVRQLIEGVSISRGGIAKYP